MSGGRGKVRSTEMGRSADAGQQVLDDCEMQHLLCCNVGNGLAPTLNSLQLNGCDFFLSILFERKRCIQVLAHDRMLELGGQTQHANQRFAMFDDDRRFGRRTRAAERQHARQLPLASV